MKNHSRRMRRDVAPHRNENYIISEWRQVDRRIILASQSPRRREILKLMGLRFTSAVPKIADEEKYLRRRSQPGVGRLSFALRTLARAKALSVASMHPDALVLGADTVVVLGKNVLGKPKNRRDAGRMISLLSGTTHSVFTAVALICVASSFCVSAVSKTFVTFRIIPEQERDDYLGRSTDWCDKAGAYAIQGDAMSFIDRIDGCYYNVVGLPVRTTIDCLTKYNFHTGLVLKGQRACQTKTK